MNIEFLYIPLVTGPIFLLGGLFLFKFPPKNINFLYGYRTKSSMKSQVRWDFAQIHSSKEMMKWGVFLTILGLIGSILNLSKSHNLILGLVFLIISTISLIIQTEKAIKNKFDIE